MATAKKLPSGNYRVRVYDNKLKKTQSFTAPTKKEAEKMASDWLNNNRAVKECRITVEKAIQSYIDNRKNILSPASIDRYQRTLNIQISSEFKYLIIKNITEEDLIAEVNRLAEKYSPKTVKSVYGLIVSVCKQYRRDLFYDDVQLPKVFKKKKVYPTAEEIMTHFKGDRMELEVLLALCYGLRKEEIRGLKKSDFRNGTMTINRVKLDAGKETVVKENSAKTISSIRQIYNVHQEILDLIEERSLENDDFICNMSGHAIYMHFRREMEKIGYGDITFHDLRHINASIMLALGVPDKYAMERCGWSTNDTLKNIYQSTINSERIKFDKVIDGYFSNIFATKLATNKESAP